MQAIFPNKYTVTIDGTDYTKYVSAEFFTRRRINSRYNKRSIIRVQSNKGAIIKCARKTPQSRRFRCRDGVCFVRIIV